MRPVRGTTIIGPGRKHPAITHGKNLREWENAHSDSNVSHF